MVHLRQVYIVSRCCESRHLHFCIQTECHYQETQESSCTLESAFRMPLKKMTIKCISTPTKRLLKALSALTIRDRKLYVQIAKAARLQIFHRGKPYVLFSTQDSRSVFG